MLAPEAITQGAVLASILAGFAFVGSTSAKPPTTVWYFAAGMLLLFSLWGGLLYFMAAESPASQGFATWGFALGLGLGIFLFLQATHAHIYDLHGESTARTCMLIGAGIFALGLGLLVAMVLYG